MTAIQIRPLTPEDAEQCVDIHLQAFQGFFLTFLGRDFLFELYCSISRDPSCIGFVAEEDGRLLGFVSGTDQPPGLYKRLLSKRLWQFGWASLGALARKPIILPRLLRAFTKPSEENTLARCGTLMSIAVLPQAQGRGIGRMLVQAFTEEACIRGLEQINLTTDRLNNEYANCFYQRLGFQLYRTYSTPEGRMMNEYVLRVKPGLPGKEEFVLRAYTAIQQTA